MRKIELLKILSQYDDNQEILVEAADGGFDDPIVYVSSACVRNSEELHNAVCSEYKQGVTVNGFGAVVLGTSVGFAKLR